MKRILFVITSLAYGGVARQALLLGKGLAKDRFQVETCVLRERGPWCEDLVAANVGVVSLGWQRGIDVRPLARLRAHIRAFRPDVIHVFGLTALRAVSAASFGLGIRLVVIAPWPPSTQRIHMNQLDRRLLRRADKVLAGGPFEADAYRSFGLRQSQIAEIAPSVDLEAPSPAAQSIREALGLSPDIRVIACVGPIDADKGFRNAVWAFDILQFVYSDLRLVIIGAGSDLPRVRRFARLATVEDKVYFLGSVPSVPCVLSEVDIVWVPSSGNTGVNAILEGMAAGKLVIASSRPMIADLIRQGETGILVPPNDQGALARHTRLLLDDPDRCRQLGAAARMQVEKRNDAAMIAREYERLYQSLGT